MQDGAAFPICRLNPIFARQLATIGKTSHTFGERVKVHSFGLCNLIVGVARRSVCQVRLFNEDGEVFEDVQRFGGGAAVDLCRIGLLVRVGCHRIALLVIPLTRDG